MTLWVFGYGSLLWNPGFDPADQVVATLQGYSRSFCMRSIHHRGSEEEPGLVLALDKDERGLCHGLAMQVQHGEENRVLAYLRERELISSAYFETHVMLDMADGRRVEAVAYVIDPDHNQYCHLELEVQAQIIASASGGMGPNWEYLYNTADHLKEIGLEDTDLNWLSQRVAALLA